MADEDVFEGDGAGWEQNEQPAYRVLEAAECGDAQKVRELVQAAGVPLGQIIWGYTYLLSQGRSTYAGLKFLLEVCGTATSLNSCSNFGWTVLASATVRTWDSATVRTCDLRTLELLLSRGANPNQRVVNMTYNATPLELINDGNVTSSARTRRLISHLLLRYGAEISPAATDPYLCKVAAAGGLRAYEKAHRRALATTLTRVAFPCLPVDVVSHVVAFSFHTGYY